MIPRGSLAIKNGQEEQSKKPLKAPPPPVDPAHIDYKDVPLWRSKSSLRQFQLAMSNKEKDTYQDNVRFLNALKNHEWPLAERLQEEGADMYAKTGERGFNCLHHFAMEKDLQAFSWLMASRKTRGDGPEGLMVTADDGATPLLLACAQGQKTMVELLCSEAGREMMDKPNDTGHTPLYMAVQGNHVNLVTWFRLQKHYTPAEDLFTRAMVVVVVVVVVVVSRRRGRRRR